MKKSKPIKVRYRFEEVSPKVTQEKLDDIFDFIFDRVIKKLIRENKDKYENRKPKT